jgi:flagellin-specific chaperone FliS
LEKAREIITSLSAELNPEEKDEKIEERLETEAESV